MSIDIYRSERSDLHIHTIASDGDLLPYQIIELAVSKNLKTISITDHDSIKSYKLEDNYFKISREKGVLLLSGIEMDSMYNEVEVHILGFDFDINNKNLNEFLKNVADQRKKRLFEQIEEINKNKGKEIINKRDVIQEYRDTYMKPHLILELLKTKEFCDYKYRDVNEWLKKNIRVKTTVNKPDSKYIIKMIKEAGGQAFLAHPGYYIFYKTLDLEKIVIELKKAGLDGLEYKYPYNYQGSNINKKNEIIILEKIMMLAKKYDLLLSRGSDTHDEKRFNEFNKIKTI